MNRKSVLSQIRRRLIAARERILRMLKSAPAAASRLSSRAKAIADNALRAIRRAFACKRKSPRASILRVFGFGRASGSNQLASSAAFPRECKSPRVSILRTFGFGRASGSNKSASSAAFRAVRTAFVRHADAIRYYGVLIAVLAVLASAAIRYRDARMRPQKASMEPESRNVSVQITPAPTAVPREPLLLPTGEIIGAYSADTLSWSETLSQWQTHPAVDFACAEGEAVLAMADGVVRERAYDPLLGNTIVIDHGDGRIARYASLNTLELVAVGQRVARGDVISAAGTCLAEDALGAHVHIAYYLNSVPEDVTAADGE